MPSLDQIGIAVIAPHDMALDRELWRWVPDDVSVFFTRTPPSQRAATLAMIEEISGTDAVTAAAASLAATRSRSYGYACTSCSFIRGVAGERAQVDAMLSAGAPAATTASGAIVEALTHLGAGRVVAATPYNDELTGRFEAFLREAGFGLSNVANLDLEHDIRHVAYERTIDMITAADRDDADAICIACTNLPTYEAIAPLEAELGKPVISANQALMWSLLRHAGVAAEDPGQRLFIPGDNHDDR